MQSTRGAEHRRHHRGVPGNTVVPAEAAATAVAVLVVTTAVAVAWVGAMVVAWVVVVPAEAAAGSE
jgi:hypothetical protein